MKLSGKFEVVEILKPTKRKGIQDLVVGEIFEITMDIQRHGYSRKSAVWLNVFVEDKSYSYSTNELYSIFKELIKIKQVK